MVVDPINNYERDRKRKFIAYKLKKRQAFFRIFSGRKFQNFQLLKKSVSGVNVRQQRGRRSPDPGFPQDLLAFFVSYFYGKADQ